MEEIRALLQNMNNQQQQQHQHTHSHLSPTDSPPQGDHTHSHGHSHGAEPGGEGLGGAGPLDIRSVLKLLQTSGVFFILLLLRFVYDHCLGEGVEFLFKVVFADAVLLWFGLLHHVGTSKNTKATLKCYALRSYVGIIFSCIAASTFQDRR